jgi:hypothetical protein
MPAFNFNHRVANRSRKPAAANSSPNGLGEGINITNLPKVWRRGTSNSFVFTAPQNYFYACYIVEHESAVAGSPNIVKTVTGTYVAGNPVTVSHTFTALGAYDIKIVVQKGALIFSKNHPLHKGIVCSFEDDFNEGDAGVTTYDMSTVGTGGIGYKLFSGDNTGKKFIIKNLGPSTGYLGIEGLTSTDPQNPWRMKVVSTSSQAGITAQGSYGIRFNRNCRNGWFDACFNSSIPYGFKIEFSGTGGHAQSCFIEAGDSGTVASTVSKNLWILGIECIGLSGTSSDSSSHFKIDTPFNVNLNYNTWMADGQGAFEDCHIMHCKITSGDDEGCYLGPVDDAPHPTYISVPIMRLRIAGISINDTGGDGFQIGAATIDSEAAGVVCTNVATRNDPSHKNIFQFSSGNRNLAFFMNKGVSGKNMLTIATGHAGFDLHVFSNELNCPTSDSNGHTNIFVRVDQNTLGGFTNLPVNFINNTIIANENKIFELWNAASSGITTIMDLKIINNMIIGDGSALTTKFNNIQDSTWVVANNTYGTDGAAAGFANWGTKDYHPAGLTGSMYGAVTSYTKAHYMQDYDMDGYGWVAAYPIRNAYQNVPAMT